MVSQSVGPLSLAELAATLCLWSYPVFAFFFSRIRSALYFADGDRGSEEWCAQFVSLSWLLQIYCCGEELLFVRGVCGGVRWVWGYVDCGSYRSACVACIASLPAR